MGYYVTSARVISRCMQLEFGVRQKSRSTPGDWKLTFHFRIVIAVFYFRIFDLFVEVIVV